jgi:hypothetical protein
MNRTVTPTDALLGYLTAIGGVDRMECWDEAGNPDPLAARRMAEDLRARAGAALDATVKVEQSANRVTIRLIADAHAAV